MKLLFILFSISIVSAHEVSYLGLRKTLRFGNDPRSRYEDFRGLDRGHIFIKRMCLEELQLRKLLTKPFVPAALKIECSYGEISAKSVGIGAQVGVPIPTILTYNRIASDGSEVPFKGVGILGLYAHNINNKKKRDELNKKKLNRTLVITCEEIAKHCDSDINNISEDRNGCFPIFCLRSLESE